MNAKLTMVSLYVRGRKYVAFAKLIPNANGKFELTMNDLHKLFPPRLLPYNARDPPMTD